MRRGITAITLQLMNAAKSNTMMAKGKASGGPAGAKGGGGGESGAAGAHHHHGGANLWKKITFFGVFPSVLLIAAYVVTSIRAEEFERPEFHPYEHMRIRRKAYPWDRERTFFHNKHRNALPDGYEEDEEEGKEEEGGGT